MDRYTREWPVIAGIGDFETSDRAREYVNDVLDSGRLSYGPYVMRFEKVFAELHDSKYAVMSNSGTSSLHVALQALKICHNWEDGDEVIVPATTFVATPNIVIHNRLKPVFVDVEADYYGIDVAQIERKIGPRTRCIIPVHLFGQACQIDRVVNIAKSNGLKVIEDSCESMFVSYEGKVVGSFGDIACFSTYVAHLISTGVGGLAITNNDTYAVIMRSLINHGRDSLYTNIDDDDVGSEKLDIVIKKRFSFEHHGHSFRPTELEAAIGLAQLEDWQNLLSRRVNNANTLTAELKHLSNYLQLPKVREGSEHAYMMYPVVVNSGDKVALCQHLERKGVETRDMMPLVNQPVYTEYFPELGRDFPVSKLIAEKGFYIGCHPNMSYEVLEHSVNAIESYYIKPKIKEKKILLVLIASTDETLNQRRVSRLELELFSRIIVVSRENIVGQNLFRTSSIPTEHLGRTFCDMGLLYARIGKTAVEDWIVICDLGLGHNVEDIKKIIFHLHQGNKLVIASRFLPDGLRYRSNISTELRGLGNRLITLLLNLAYDVNFVDSFQSFRGFSKDLVKCRHIPMRRVGHYRQCIYCIQEGYRYVEFPTKEQKIIDPLKFSGTIYNAILCIWILIREKFSKKRSSIAS